MFEVRITGTFTTGTTNPDKGLAEEEAKELLAKKLKEIRCYHQSDIFQFTIVKIESEKL